MNYVLQILQFSVGGDFWRFLGCYFIISTCVLGISNVITVLIAAINGVQKRIS